MSHYPDLQAALLHNNWEQLRGKELVVGTALIAFILGILISFASARKLLPQQEDVRKKTKSPAPLKPKLKKDDSSVESDKSPPVTVPDGEATPWSDPGKFEWMIKGVDKDFGPYSFEQILAYFENGKLRAQREIYPTTTQETVLVGEFVGKFTDESEAEQKKAA